MFNSILLQAQQGAPDYTFLFFMALMFVVLYFFMIRPQQKKQKDAKKFREDLKKGDEIVTIGGLHGTIVSVEADDSIFIEVDRGFKVKIAKWGVSAEASKKDSAKK